MSVLVTGGAGFIGSALVRRLVADGEEVVTLDKLTYAGNKENLTEVLDRANHRFVEGDICDGDCLASLFSRHGFNAVYHLAAESHVDRSIDAPAAFVSTNIAGTLQLLEVSYHHWKSLDEEARARFRFLHVSTDEVYGELGPVGRFTVESAYAPSSPYAASKASSDHLVRAWHRTYGLPTLISNCSNNYGPYQFPEKLIPLMILNALEGLPLPVYGQGDQVRDWLHVEDHVAALRSIAANGRPGETYLVGGHGERRNLEIVEAICAELDRLRPRNAGSFRDLIGFVEDRPGHDRRYAIDPRKIEQELGWRPHHDIETGLRETIVWYLDNLDWCRRTKERYQRARLGLARA